MNFSCPVCGAELACDGRSLRCENNHCYDLAKQGYVNLLMSQKSSAKRHGDDKLMVRSRSDFLDKGYYAPLRDAVVAVAKQNAAPGCVVMDAGCGEGYYTAAVCEALESAGLSPTVFGVDISRDALIAAGRRGKSLRLAVGSIFSLPVADESCDLLLNVFAPEAAQEFARVLKPGGILLRVIPLRRHLFELKAAVYDRPYENEPEDPSLPGFTLLGVDELRGEINLPCSEDIRSLFSMTPYYYKTGAADQAKLNGLTALKVTTEFGIVRCRRD